MGFFHLCNRFIQLLQSSHIDVIAVNTIQEHHRESEAIFTCSCKVGFFSSFFILTFLELKHSGLSTLNTLLIVILKLHLKET